jgi:hypothetical protein
MREQAAHEFGLTSLKIGAPAVPVSTAPRTAAQPIEMDAPPPMARAAFHGILGEIVQANDPYTESDQAAVLVQLYVLVGNVVGRSPHCYADSVRHGVNENCLVIGVTADGRKGTGLANAKQFVVPADAGWADQRIQGGLASGEGLVHAVRDPSEDDLGEPDKRLMVIESEFGGVLKVMSRKGCTVSELIRQAFDSYSLNILTRNKPARCSAPHVSIVAHTTPSDLRRYLDDVDIGNGFLNRFLIVYSKRSKLLPHGGEIPREKFFSFTAGIADAVAFARKVEVMVRDEQTRNLWDSIYADLSSGHPGVFGALTSRGAAHVTRFSMICALMDKSYFVRREHLEAALAIWTYCQDSVRFVFGDSIGDRVADSILTALRQNPAGMTVTDISITVFRRNETAASIDRALKTLESLHMVRRELWTQSNGKGRSADRWLAVDPRRRS